MATIFHYCLCGLTVESHIALPAADAIAPAEADVRITYGLCPPALDAPTHSGPNWQANDTALLLTVSPSLRLMMEQGRSIVVDAAPDTDRGEIALWVTGSGIGTILHQRGRIVLHGSAVLVDDGALVFCGPSGAGKSTTAAAFAAHGFPIVCDDVCAMAPGTMLQLHRDGRKLKLFPDSLSALGLDGASAGPVCPALAKHYVAPPLPATGGPYPVRAIYLLERGDDFSLEPLTGGEAVRALLLQAYRPQLVKAFGQGEALLKQCMAALPHLAVFRLRCPNSLAALPNIIDRIVARI